MEVVIDGVRYVPALDAETIDISPLVNRLWGGVGGRSVFFRFSRGTAKNVFADSSLAIPHANPIFADARGFFPQIWTNAPSVLIGLRDEHDIMQAELEAVTPYHTLPPHPRDSLPAGG